MNDDERERLIAMVQRADARGDALEAELLKLRGDRGRETLQSAIKLARTAAYLMMLVVLFGATMVVTRACEGRPPPCRIEAP